MNLHELCPAEVHVKRLGQGLGSGKGKTAGKGHKDRRPEELSIKLTEGGQMPPARRIPKRGFNNYRFAVRYETVNISDLEDRFENGSVITESLYALRLISAADKRSRYSVTANFQRTSQCK